MRTPIWLAGLVVGLGWAGPASAQWALTWGGPVSPIVQQVVNTQNVNVPIAQPQYLPSRSFSSMSLTQFIPPAFTGNSKPVLGSSQFPTPAQLPGSNYLKSFQFRRQGPIQP
jgi:hypothetical protein